MSVEISVVVPSFNRAAFLPETLESIRSQTHPPAEVIVVDDGSKDNTEEVVRPFRPLVKYCRIENSGVCRARNVGVSMSHAAWLAFCDSDDVWYPQKLARQVRLIESAPEVEFVFTNFATRVGHEVLPGSKFDALPPGYWDVRKRLVGPDLIVLDEVFYAHVLRAQPVFPSTVLLSRLLFERKGGFDESLGRNVSEDLEFTLRCLEGKPTGVVMTPLVQIRKHAGNLSADPMRSLIDEIAILSIALERHPTARLCRDMIATEIARRRHVAADFAFRRGDLDLARGRVAGTCGGRQVEVGTSCGRCRCRRSRPG